MNTRTLVTIIFALALIGVVMCVAAAMTYIGWVGIQKFDSQISWRYSYSNTQSMKIIDLTGDGQDNLFIQNLNNLSVLDAAGNPLFSYDFPSDLVTTLGDVTSDGIEDVVAYSPDGVALISKGEKTREIQVSQLGRPARAAVIRYPGGPQIILGDQSGRLASLDPGGQVLWQGQLSSGDVIRGLDDGLVNGQIMLAAANHDGSVALYDAQGQTLWTYTLPGGLRRLRSYDLNGDGNSEILLGGESGRFVMLNAASGAEITSASLGQPISEIREAEIDGDPSSREFVLGGKDGGVWAYNISGQRLWSASLGDKVTEITGLDLNGDGAQEVIIGADSGEVVLFTGKSGQRANLMTRPSGITRIDEGRLGAARQVAIADASEVDLMAVRAASLPPLRFAPLVMGLIVSLVIAIAAWFIATIPPKPAQRLAIEDQSPESLQAQRRMLKESLADVERLKSSGEMTPAAYLARLKELRGQLADNETAMKKAGMQFTPETFNCPHCGGTLQLGVDRCDYCGQVVIT
jgi:outer membrane protein assembly factor BamB